LAYLPRPTRTGWYFWGGASLLFFAGVWYQENAFVLLSCIPLAMLLVNLALCWLGLRRIEVRRELPGYTHAGEAVDVGLVVINRSRLPRFGLELVDGKLPDLYRDEPATLVQYVRPGHAQRTGYAAVFGRRGRHDMHWFEVACAFPFGLARLKRRVACHSETVVYPRPYRLSREFERLLLRGARFFGESSASNRGQEEVFGVREYLPGHNVARIHWPTTARTGKPMVLELEGRQDASFCVILDAFPVGEPATLRTRLESAIGLCAGLAYFFTGQGVLFRFALHGESLNLGAPGRGDSHYHAVMERLALAGLGEKPLGEWVGQVEAGGARESPVVVTLGPKEHAEARLPADSGAFIVSVAEQDFRHFVSFDPLGRRSVDVSELSARMQEAA